MPFCTQCGQQVQATDVFCASCGRPQIAVRPRQPVDPLAAVSPRTASILCYIPTVGWLAAVFVLTSRRFKQEKIVRFHAFQGLYLFALWLIVQWVIHPMMWVPDRTMRVDHLLDLLLVGVAIFMMIKASHNEAYILPIVGELAQRSAAEH